MNNQNRTTQDMPNHKVLLMTALLMALGWAINGMIGNAPGGAIPGAFLGMAVVGILGLVGHTQPEGSKGTDTLVRVAAFGAMGFWFGGEMTYGQTLGLTNVNVAGGEHYWWGILGTAVKGGAWSGLGAAFIGLGLMHRRYRTGEIALLVTVMTIASVAGLALLNRPLSPSDTSPPITFSYDPVNPENAPRTESWGAIWAGLLVLVLYARAWKKDFVTFRFGLFGILGGGLGFSIGQMFQAFSWAHREFALSPWIDWWKVMELTHGFIVGLFVAAAALRTQRNEIDSETTERKPLSPVIEWTGIAVWIVVVIGYFLRHPVGEFLAVFPFIGGVIVFAGLVFGRWWPWVIVGLQMPLSTALITSNEAMQVFPSEIGYRTSDGTTITLLSVLSYAWPMIVISLFVCTIPMAVWLYRRPSQKRIALNMFLLFVGYHVFAVLVQMIWRTLCWAPSWSLYDLAMFARPFYALILVYVLCYGVVMVWFPRITRQEEAENT